MEFYGAACVTDNTVYDRFVHQFHKNFKGIRPIIIIYLTECVCIKEMSTGSELRTLS
jgi:hypothetical protein